MRNKLEEFFKGKRVLILGLGREGRSTLDILKNIDCTIGIADRNLIATDELSEYELYLGENYLNCLGSFDIIMKSPGIALLNMVSDEIKAKITSQTDLLLRFRENTIIGITGTKGKSTTSSLTCHILKECGKNAILIGNIGIPPLECIDEFTEDTIIVCEMSCHQLEYVQASPDIAVLLNIFEEHLDHYVDFNAYKNAKENIYHFMDEKGTLIIGSDCVHEEFGFDVLTASLDNGEADIYVTNDTLSINGIKIPISGISTKLIGHHNFYNIGIAMCVALALGCDKDKALEAVSTFNGLPHRLENIGTFGGVQYITDSISTCPSTAIAAVKSFDKVDTIIIGGMDRGIDYTELVSFINSSDIENIILLPDSGYRIYSELDGKKRNIYKAENLIDAVRYAKTVTKVRCLLSPAAASYGFYKNFEERGEHFKELVTKQ
ncbi:MAG: UDP-N-acetylmuramoyl-L-alanine--D-glutamate ligase [Ruminiclostridium sp.]|nr:UDP-N-acetylmuramoyl-L-alanine--D-glutamate ligase [Ruminiclostridium sp.]